MRPDERRAEEKKRKKKKGERLKTAERKSLEESIIHLV